MKHQLVREGAPIVNIPLLGAFARAANLVSLEHIEKGLMCKLSGDAAATNVKALKDAFEETTISKRTSPSSCIAQ
jgi:Pyruvate/2-oxoacid:ferredoxin oxidoreductase gamma subunit